MDLGEKDKYGMDGKNEDHMNYPPGVSSSDWRFDGSNLTNSSMGLVGQPGNPIAIGSSSCSSAPVADSYVPTPAMWDHHPAGSQNLGFCDIGALGIRKGSPVDMCWKGGLFMPSMPGAMPPSLSQLPADSAFIERAARFSSFNSGSFGDVMSPFAMMPESMGGLYSTRSVGGGQEVFAGNDLRSEASRDDAAANAAEGSPLKSERRRGESLAKSHDEAKQALGGGSENESDEAEFSSECAGGEASTKGIGSKKRKRNGKDSNNQANDTEPQQNNPSTTTNKTAAKNGKQGSQASDPTKEDYIHVRARRGQATNSHSLAERVRREKISERMKFLQDLVPGCNKVTGKAVMLDEIINYVQSLQRQVEFLSMKLATVNPRLDFNLEGLLAKDMLQPRGVGSSSSLAFAPDMPITYPALQLPQQGLIQGLPGMGSASEILRRTINSQLTPSPVGYKEPSQLPNVWEDELNNVVQMSFGTRTSPTTQDATPDGSLPGGQMKIEL